MATPLPNSAHGDQLISAKARGTARVFERPSYVTRCILDCNSPKTPSQGVRIRPLHLGIGISARGQDPELAYLELQMRRLKTSQASDRRPSPLSHDEVHQN